MNIRNFENAIICGKICDMRIFAKYAIACSHIMHITGIPIQSVSGFFV